MAKHWNNISSTKERAHWEEEARKDKLRYYHEKEHYKGPWRIPNKRTKKDPDAPKRPMSAFLHFAQKERALLKQQDPSLTFVDISKSLSKKWKSLEESIRKPHLEWELKERAIYNKKVAEYKAKKEKEKRIREQEAMESATTQYDAVTGRFQNYSSQERKLSIKEVGFTGALKSNKTSFTQNSNTVTFKIGSGKMQNINLHFHKIAASPLCVKKRNNNNPACTPIVTCSSNKRQKYPQGNYQDSYPTTSWNQENVRPIIPISQSFTWKSRTLEFGLRQNEVFVPKSNLPEMECNSESLFKPHESMENSNVVTGQSLRDTNPNFDINNRSSNLSVPADGGVPQLIDEPIDDVDSNGFMISCIPESITIHANTATIGKYSFQVLLSLSLHIFSSSNNSGFSFILLEPITIEEIQSTPTQDDTLMLNFLNEILFQKSS